MATNYEVLEHEDEEALAVLVNAKFAEGYVVAGGVQGNADPDGKFRYHQAVYKP